MLSYHQLLRSTSSGLYCPAGDFHIDPVSPVPRAVVSHAHSDHARPGSRHYLAASRSEHLLRMRLGSEAELQLVPYGEEVVVRGVRISFHPAGHILGSSQIRLEHQGRVAVVSGDYKLGTDLTCEPWVPIHCDLFVTETTFALPVYRWPDQDLEMSRINQWWRENRDAGKCSLLYGYAVGKSQRLLAGLDPEIGPIYTHGAVEKGVEAYRRSGVALPDTTYVGSVEGRHDYRGAMVVAVPSAHGSMWARRFGKTSTAMASGWMAIRGARRRRSVDRGFVISDHVDWPTMIQAIDACDPEQVWVTHGYTEVAARYLGENGRHAEVLDGRGRLEESEESAPASVDEETA